MSVAQFALTLPTHSLAESLHFYTHHMGCTLLSQTPSSLLLHFYAHRLSIVLISPDFSPQEHCNHVDKHDVPVPHFGVVLSKEEFHELSERLTAKETQFIIEPHLRFEGLVGEQYTMFFKDPTGNNLEFKAMTNPHYLFAK